MPTITYWPGVVEEGQVNNELWTQTDFFPSFARLAGYEIPEGHAVDSEDMLDVILGKIGYQHSRLAVAETILGLCGFIVVNYCIQPINQFI